MTMLNAIPASLARPVVRNWRAVSSVPSLEPGSIHVWRVALINTRLDEYICWLASDEIARAANYIRDVDRTRFIRRRVSLRQLLGAYTNAPPEEVRFIPTEHGRPKLPDADGTRFSVSHSGDWAIIAVARSAAIGVDVEQICPIGDCEQLSYAFFGPLERQSLARIPEGRRFRAFFDCWVRKEAYLKMTGRGLSKELLSVDLQFLGDRIAVIDGREQRMLHFISEAAPASNYAAAIVAERTDSFVDLFDSSALRAAT
jgi:4'-phosphopantetheinyl transferase